MGDTGGVVLAVGRWTGLAGLSEDVRLDRESQRCDAGNTVDHQAPSRQGNKMMSAFGLIQTS